MPIIELEELNFFQQALKEFKKDENLSTYRDAENMYIALRFSGRSLRDSIAIYRVEKVADFKGVLKPGRPLILGEEEL